MSGPSQLIVERSRFAAELKRLRESSGQSTYALASQLGWSQSKVTKIETGRTMPSLADVQAWARATGASAEQAVQLTERAERARTEAVTWRAALRQASLPRLQHEVGALERIARLLRVYQPIMIPGLLQTSEYARLLYEARTPPDDPDLGPAVVARMERQALLYDRQHRFEFVIAEPALRWRLGPTQVQLAQLDRIRNLATLPNVWIGLLPMSAPAPGFHDLDFTLFEERSDEGDSIVFLETATAGFSISEPEDVEVFRQGFDRLRKASLTGRDAANLITGVAEDLSRPSE